MKKTMKKLFAFLLAVSMAISLAACGSSKSATTSPSTAPSSSPAAETATKLKVAMVCSGSLGDTGIFDMGEAALKKAATDYGVEYKVLEGKNDPSLYYGLLNTAASQFNLVFVNPGYQFDSYLEEIATAYPDVTFVYADGTSSLKLDNVISVSYRENEGSYLAGVMAAMMTTRTDIKGINADKVLGFVGAVDSTTINNFLTGFQQGVASVDSSIKVLPVYVGNYNDPATGKEMALSLYNQGADIIYAAASNSGDGVSEAAVAQGKYVIGVDTDKSSQGPENVMGSMLKNVTTSFYDVIGAKINGTTLTKVQREGLAKKWVELYFSDYMNKFIPTDVMDAVNKAQSGIIDGTITVNEAK
jgi:basic membrane protein A and related proteins